MKNKSLVFRRIFFTVIVFLFGILAVVPVTAAITYAEHQNSILDDFEQDKINISDYPSQKDNYSLNVIRIAETKQKTLVIYVYQPSTGFRNVAAKEISMSITSDIRNPIFQLYTLKYLGAERTIYKYLVESLTVSDEVIRYYNVASIYRDFIPGIDKEPGNDNEITDKAYNVGKLFKAKNENDGVSYEYEVVDTVEIIDPYSGFLEYFNGYKFCVWSHCHGHYVAFSTDRQIDYLQEADLTYYTTYRHKKYSSTSGWIFSSDPSVKGFKTVKGTEKGSNPADGFLGKKYEWERIQTVDDFIKQEDLKDEVKTALNGKKWVLRFLETPCEEKSNGFATTYYWTELANVTVLRLKFITDFKTYNLGTVSDKVTGDNKPGNNNTDEVASIWEWLERVTGVPRWLWKVLFIVIILAVLLPVLSLVFPVVGQVLKEILKGLLKGIKVLFKALLWLITAPFRLVKWIVEKIRERKGGAA